MADALLANGSAEPKAPFSVSKYNSSVERKVKEFPKVWVQGVITQLQVRGKVAYLTLAEFAEGDAKPKAVLDVILWTWNLDDYNARFAQLPTPFSLRPELKVSFLLEASFYAPSGRFQPKVLDVDETFTLGELSLTRGKILEKLRKEGLLERNKKLPFSDVPLRVGLITSKGSAAFQDFTTVLLQSGFSFQIHFASARMQGAATEETVVAALETLAPLRLDAICLIRGGGSKTDLVFFDSERICRAIAGCPVPVLTGIGHEIDRSLADMVAYADMLTPTDCAKFLEGRVGESWNDLVEKASSLREAWELAYQDQGHNVIRKAEWLSSAWKGRARRESGRMAEGARNTAAAARRMLRAGRDKMALNFTGLLRGPSKVIRLESVGLELKEKLIQSADPAALLKRGFTLVFTGKNEWIANAEQLKTGQEIKIRFSDGAAAARVLGKEDQPWKPAN